MVLVVEEWSIPLQLKNRLCMCKGLVDFTYDSTLKVSRCKVCNKFPPHIARKCQGCGVVFLVSFSHPDECSRTPLCWDCLHDPLCDDLIKNHLPCGLNHSVRQIEPPRFTSMVPPFIWDGVSAFSFTSKETSDSTV